MKHLHILAIALLISTLVSANTKRADRLFDKWDYNKAAMLYEKEAKNHPSQDVYYKLGLCYQKMHRYPLAIEAYDKVNSMGAYGNPDFYLNYGLMLKTGERYTDAETAFTTYANMMPSDTRGTFYKNSCDTVMEDINYNLPISIIGVTSLNSNMSDLCPTFYKDGVVFISSRKAPEHGTKTYGWDGEYYLDIWSAKKGKTDTSFTDISPLPGVVNGKFHNGPVCFTKGYDTIYVNKVSRDLKGQEKRTLKIERNKIYSAVYKNGTWVDLKPFPYNNDTFSIATPCLANNGTRIYFSSDKPGGYGGDDIYYCDWQNGSWGKPVNAGPNINTFGDEKFPSVDSAGNLYFSSNGYKGFGGMDICVAKKVNGDYAQAHVLKEPFNSPADDYGITFVKQDKIGYFSSNRSGSKGDEDIYYFNMEKDSLPCKVATSDYIIGFRCTPKPVATLDTNNRNLVLHTRIPANRYNFENELSRVHFDFDKYYIRPDAASILDSVATFLDNNPNLKIMVNGYCDTRGTIPYNQVLSERRSNSAVDYLASKGIDRNRMSSRGYGKTHLLNGCSDGVSCTEAQQQENRRVEVLYSPNQNITPYRP